MTHLPSWAVPGRKVVCVDANNTNGYVWHDNPPVKGEVYTISGVFIDRIVGVAVDLIEKPRPIASGLAGCHLGYSITRFRPVVTLEDDMLTFRSLLNTVPTTLTSETSNVE